MADPAANMCVIMLPPERNSALRSALEAHCWDFSDHQYAQFKATKEKTSVILYNSGKLVIQGKGTKDFVEFVLEPEVLCSCPITGAEQEEKPEIPFTAHAGMDESGKGDFFGPLVACAAFVPDKATENALLQAGVCDCKLIKSDTKLRAIAAKIATILKGKFAIVSIGPEAYNRMYQSFRSINTLLAWAHARALENLLEKTPECTEAIADKFGDDSLICKALGERGKKIHLIQRVKAESDMAVAAASILARAGFLRKLDELSELAGIVLPKGGGEQTDEPASRLAVSGGREHLGKFAKLHFRNTYKALGEEPPPKPVWQKH